MVKAMFMTKVKVAAAARLLLALTGFGATVMMAQEDGLRSGDEKPVSRVADQPAPLAREPAKGDAQKDVAKFEGGWEVIAYDSAGKALNGGGRRKRLVFSKDKIEFETAVENGEHPYRLDVSKKPKQIDMTLTENDK